MLTAVAQAWPGLRIRKPALHRRVGRVYVSIITNRIWTPVLFISLHPLQDSVFDGNEEHYLWFAAGLGAWLGWTIPVFAVQ
jgi:hypothetical protein